MKALQELIKQDIERSERLTDTCRGVELARIAAEKEKIVADKEIEMARIESIERQAEKDREGEIRLKVIRLLPLLHWCFTSTVNF